MTDLQTHIDRGRQERAKAFHAGAKALGRALKRAIADLRDHAPIQARKHGTAA